METAEARLIRLREERAAREKARIEKLRELNLNKYKKNETQTPGIRPSFSSAPVHRPSKSDAAASSAQNLIKASKSVKSNFYVNGSTKRPITVPLKSHKPSVCRNLNSKPKVVENVNVEGDNIVGNVRPIVEQASNHEDHGHHNKAGLVNKSDNKDRNVGVEVEQARNNVNNEADPVKKPVSKIVSKNFVQANKLIQCKQSKTQESIKQKPYTNARKSVLPHSSNISNQKVSEKNLHVNPNRQSVFDRLYQPKVVPKKELKEVEKIQTDAKCSKKATKNSAPTLYKRHTCFEPQKVQMPVRRSISAVHFKKIKKSEKDKCIHKWASVGEKLDEISLKDINEDHSVKGDKVVSAVKSEKKRVQFQTPIHFSFNTPKREELQARLQSWLQKRGKSIDSYHHLQCFGIQHLSSKIEPFNLLESVKYDDENKENIPLDSDSDNESYNENMNEHANVEDQAKAAEADKNKWRHASIVSESADFNDTRDTTLTSVETPHPKAGTLLLGALNDLTELLREGFDWEQCARWLRAIRSRFPSAPDNAAYWECRAALEERRGDLPSSIHCWEEAIAKGTERSVVEANLDQLLDKFMQLQISPSNDLRLQPSSRMIDVKNIFKSTIIRFAVQQAKLRQSTGGAGDPPKYTCTPVRRSARLSHARTPLQVCASVKQAALLADPVVFVPNRTLSGTP